MTKARLIPKDPRLTFRGELQSQEFTQGAFAVFDALGAFDDQTSRFDGPAAIAAVVFDNLQRFLNVQGDTAVGALAGIASYLADIIDGGAGQEFGDFQPLQQDFTFGIDSRDPPRGSLYFEVCGAPVSATLDHLAYRWDAEDGDPISIELVRGLGKPISRKKFDQMRAELEGAK